MAAVGRLGPITSVAALVARPQDVRATPKSIQRRVNYTFNGDVTGSDGTATINELTLSGTLNPGGTISVSSGDIILATPVTTAPEPASLLLVGSGLLGLAGIKRLRSGC